jgi:hypothetical protein
MGPKPNAELRWRSRGPRHPLIVLRILYWIVLTSSTLLLSPYCRAADDGDADTYFKTRKAHREVATSSSKEDAARFMEVYAGGFLTQTQYKWGHNGDNIGQFNAGVSYRFGEWEKSMDFLFRADVTRYNLNEGNATKLSLLPMVIFPDAASRFPLYFGAGAGLGIFFQQIRGQSALAFEYQLVAGVRFFNIWDSVGFMIETGLRNHIHLLSEGQWNSVFLDAGAVFSF